MEEDKQKKEVNKSKNFPTPKVIKAMEKMQDLIVRSQPKPKE